ncbi:MAG: hypothetical protein ACR5LA_05795 [Wolbachia sp.]
MINPQLGFNKDLELVSSLMFGMLSPTDLETFIGDTVDMFNDFVKAKNPMSEGIRGNHFNTGTTAFSTLNLIMRGAAVAADYTAHSGDNQNSMSKKALGFFGDSSIRRAKEEIARLGKDVHKEVAEKCIYEYLEMLRAGLNGRNYSPPQEPGDLPPTLLNVCHSQKFLKDYKKASEDLFPASLIASPNAKKLDGVQKVWSDGIVF